MNTNNAKNMHMTAEVWNALTEMMDTNQLNYFIEYLEQVKKVLISDEVVTNCVEDLGGADRVLLMLNNFDHMSKLFKTINIALEAKGGEA